MDDSIKTLMTRKTLTDDDRKAILYCIASAQIDSCRHAIEYLLNVLEKHFEFKAPDGLSEEMMELISIEAIYKDLLELNHLKEED